MILLPDRNCQGDGTDWLSFTGEINVDSEVTIGGFKAAGLWVKVRSPFFCSYFFLCRHFTQDCIVFSITPPDSLKGPIGDMRCVVPIRLVTDPPWVAGNVPSNEPIPQASPTTSEVYGSLGNIDGVEGDYSPYNKSNSHVTFETME
jgi:hypothetical protein